MSNLHEYVFFDRAKLDPALAMGWSAFERVYSGWNQWRTAREFLVEWGLDDRNLGMVDDFVARKTVGSTIRLNGDGFPILYAILDSNELAAVHVEIPKRDYDYAGDIVSCAGAGYESGKLSFASLAATYQLHADSVDPECVLSHKVAKALKRHAGSSPMLPHFPEVMVPEGTGLGISQTRRVITFLTRAWKERWPLRTPGRAPSVGRTIRECAVAELLIRGLRGRRLSKPCVFRWFEC